MVLLAVRMVVDVTETRNVIPSLEFKILILLLSNYKLFCNVSVKKNLSRYVQLNKTKRK